MAEPIGYLEGVIDGQGRIAHLPINSLPCRIGRKVELELQLNDPRISSVHAEIFAEGDRLFVRDLGSTNGTFVNNRRVEGPSPIISGDILRLAVVELRFRRQGEDPVSVSADTTAIISSEEFGQKLFGHLEFLKLVEEERVIPFFQPIVRMAGREVAGYEVLGRGNMPGLPESPIELFQMAATYGMQANLSELFRRVGIRTASQMTGDGFVFVNMHPREVGSSQLVESLRELRADYPAVPIVLELHESAVTDTRQMRELREQLAELEVGLAYDDFGAGRARLNELADAPPDFIKFDASLIHELDSAPPMKRQLVRQLVQLAQGMGCETLAEGVETEAERDLCEEMGFEYAQGFLFGRPRPVIIDQPNDGQGEG